MTESHHQPQGTGASRFDQPGASSTGGTSTTTGHTASSGASDPAHEARRAAHEMAQAGREQARSYIDEHRFTAAERIHGMAEALRSTARDLEGRDGQSSRFTQGAAERADRFADLLREHDADSLLSEARAMARRSPELFVGGAVTAGLLLGRFLKSSGEREHDRDDDDEPDRELHPTPPPGSAQGGTQGGTWAGARDGEGDRLHTNPTGTGRARHDG
jgi:hypothetical protein